jgi:hypothetical protein
MPTPLTQTASDSFAFGDSLAIQLGTPVSRAGGDNIFLSDSAQFLVALLSNPSDTLSLSDQLRIQRSIALALSDSLSLSDSNQAPVIAVQILLTLSDSLSLSDVVSAMPSTALDQYLRRYLNDVS